MLGLLSAGIELLAMSYLLPISAFAAGTPIPESSLPLRFLASIGLHADIRTLLMFFFLLFLLRIVTQTSAQGLTLSLSKKLNAELSSRAFASTISALALREIEKKSVGHFLTLAGDEANRASTLVFSLNQLLSTAALALLYFAAIFSYSTTIGLSVLAFLLFTLLCLGNSFSHAQRLAARQLEDAKVANSLFIDSLNNLRSVRAFQAEPYVSAVYRERILQWAKTGFQADMLNNLSRAAPALLLVIGFGLWLLLTSGVNHIDFVFVVTIVIFLLRFFPIIGQALNEFLRVVADAKPAHDISEVLDLALLRASDQGEQLTAPITVIELQDVDFSYNGADSVLHKMRAKFTRGTSYAISGPSGIGKSTLADLLVRFYDADGGKILINGRDLVYLSVRSVREHVLILGQETSIFNDTVWNNIALGKNVSEHQMHRACELACLDDVIEALPMRYQTVLSYQGANLSGGQIQRIGIARALLRQADVLILDESTSALDKDTRERVARNILEEYKERIVIFVTHDSVVAQMVDEVIHLRPSLARRQMSPSNV